MKVQVLKWGKSFAVRLPRVIVRRAHLKEGNLLKIEVREGLMKLSRHVPSLNELVAQITPENRYGEISTGIQVGREKSK